MKNKILTLILMSITTSWGQDEVSVNKNLFKLNILAPGIVYEAGLGQKVTLNSELNMGVGYSYDSFSGSQWFLFPFIDEQVRYYYNLEKRANKEKRTANNSGNYVAFGSTYFFESINKNEAISNLDGLTLSTVWGLQRTYKRNFNSNLGLGVGYNFSPNEEVSGVVPVVNFTLGWVIGGK